jgi:hypothetical protein
MKVNIKNRNLLVMALAFINVDVVAQSTHSTNNIYRHPTSLSFSNSGALVVEPSVPSGSLDLQENWVAIEDYVSEIDVSASQYTEWLPFFEDVQPNFMQQLVFSQSRSAFETRSYYTQAQERNVLTGEVRLIGEPVETSEDVILEGMSESRDVVTQLSQVYIGDVFDCTPFTPEEDTVVKDLKFMQERDCSQMTAFYVAYDEGGLAPDSNRVPDRYHLIVDESYTPHPTTVRDTNIAYGKMEGEVEEEVSTPQDLVFDLGGNFLANGKVTKSYTVSTNAESSQYSTILLDLFYDYPYPPAVNIYLYNPENELVYHHNEYYSKLGRHYEVDNIAISSASMSGIWTVVVQDYPEASYYEGGEEIMHDADSGTVDVKITLR